MDCLQAEIWALIISVLPFFDMLNLLICSKFLFNLCSKNKKLSTAKKISHDLINKDKDNDLFFASFFDEYFTMLTNEIGRYFQWTRIVGFQWSVDRMKDGNLTRKN